MNILDLDNEMESLRRRIKMKRQISEESNDIEQKNLLQRQIKDLEQEMVIFERRKSKLSKKPVKIRIPTRKLILRTRKLSSND